MKMQEHSTSQRAPKWTAKSFEKAMRPYYEERESLYEIPPGCICMGDGLMGMKCTAKEHAKLRVTRNA